MSENFDELGELGDKVKKIIDTAVSTKDYRQMTEDIKQTVGQTVNSAVNSAVDSGSEAIKNGLNNVFGTGNSQSGDSGVYRNKTKEFEEKRRREREQEQERQRIEKEKAKEKMLTLYERNTGGRMKGMMIAVSGGILASGMGLGTLVLSIFGAVGNMSSLVTGGTCFMAVGALTGVGLLAGGIKKLGKLERFQKYIDTLGNHTYCNFEQLSAAVNKPVKFVKKDIKKMIDDRWFRQGHIDEQETCLITSNETYLQYTQTQKALEQKKQEEEKHQAEQERNRKNTPPEVQEVLDKGNEFLDKIHRSNDAIPGEEISAKISRMELIVEKIFDLAIHGRGAASITRILIAEKVPTPGFINFQRDGTFANIYAGAPEEKSYAWTIAQVKSIMKDETYIGHTIHYRETNISFKNKRRVRKPQSEWVRVENTQEPIISEQVFRQVQEQIANRRRKCKDGTTQIFSGLVKCADCGWSLSYGENRQNSKPYGHYHCSKYGQGTRQCSMHYIRYDVLYAYVLSRLQYWSGLVQHDEERLLKQLLNATDKGQAAARKKQAAELKKAEKRKAEVDTLFARMYEDWAAGRITEYNFSMLSGKYQSEQAELDEKIERLQSAIATESQNAADAEKWIALMKECVNPTELTAELLNTLIEKIVVHEAVKGEDGSREQEVEIFYRFIGKID